MSDSMPTHDEVIEAVERIPLGWTTCKDGTTLSVQASAFHYCLPRTNQGPWTHVEVGFPSVKPSWWKEYTDATGEVAGYVPVELVRDFIKEHGGRA